MRNCTKDSSTISRFYFLANYPTGLIPTTHQVLLRAYYQLSKTQKEFGDIFAEIGARLANKSA